MKFVIYAQNGPTRLYFNNLFIGDVPNAPYYENIGWTSTPITYFTSMEEATALKEALMYFCPYILKVEVLIEE